MTDLTKAITEQGGDPDCLHCQVSALLNHHFETRPEGPVHAMQLALALAEIIGDLLLPAPPQKKPLCVARVMEAINDCLARKADADPTDLAAPVPPKLH